MKTKQVTKTHIMLDENDVSALDEARELLESIAYESTRGYGSCDIEIRFEPDEYSDDVEENQGRSIVKYEQLRQACELINKLAISEYIEINKDEERG